MDWLLKTLRGNWNIEQQFDLVLVSGVESHQSSLIVYHWECWKRFTSIHKTCIILIICIQEGGSFLVWNICTFQLYILYGFSTITFFVTVNLSSSFSESDSVMTPAVLKNKKYLICEDSCMPQISKVHWNDFIKGESIFEKRNVAKACIICNVCVKRVCMILLIDSALWILFSQMNAS